MVKLLPSNNFVVFEEIVCIVCSALASVLIDLDIQKETGLGWP
jgi:hypothetical protein